MPGGFIGVDVFFVISGYLITGILLAALSNDTFSISSFYSRRVRRLFPALAVVIASALVIGWWLLPAVAYAELGKQIVAGSAFMANLAFWQEAGYFDTEAKLKPLLHLWSLGVEEQFYIFWPLLLAWMWRRGYSIWGAITAVMAASFAFNLQQVNSNAVAAFYSPLTRFWELMIGCLWAAFETEYTAGRMPPMIVSFGAQLAKRQWVTEVVSVGGFALLLTGLLVVTAGSEFPGWYALLPTVGAGLILAAGPHAFLNRNLLCSRPFVWVGKISYPLYLWHWVLLVFLAEYAVPTRTSIVAIVGSAMVLAWLTYIGLERPIRRGAWHVRYVPLLAGGLSLLAIVGLVVFMSAGVPSRFSPEANRLIPLPTEAAYRYKECFIDTQFQDERSFSSACQDDLHRGQTLVLLWGDSHAAHLYAGLHKLQDTVAFRLVQYNESACSPLIGADVSSGPNCVRINRFVRGEIARLRPTVVIIGDRWSRDGPAVDAGLNQTVAFLRSNGVKEIFAVGSPPRWDPDLHTVLFWYYRRHGNVPTRMRQDAASWAALRESDRHLEQLARSNGIHFVSAVDALCNEQGCLTLVAPPPEGLVSPDYDHFSALGSDYFIAAASESGSLRW